MVEEESRVKKLREAVKTEIRQREHGIKQGHARRDLADVRQNAGTRSSLPRESAAPTELLSTFRSAAGAPLEAPHSVTQAKPSTVSTVDHRTLAPRPAHPPKTLPLPIQAEC